MSQFTITHDRWRVAGAENIDQPEKTLAVYEVKAVISGNQGQK
jgi:hypothetical protein